MKATNQLSPECEHEWSIFMLLFRLLPLIETHSWFFLFVCFSSFLASLRHMKFPGQGSDPSLSHNPSQGSNPHPSTDPVEPQWELQKLTLNPAETPHLHELYPVSCIAHEQRPTDRQTHTHIPLHHLPVRCHIFKSSQIFICSTLGDLSLFYFWLIISLLFLKAQHSLAERECFRFFSVFP